MNGGTSILVIDAGNTRIKLALIEGDRLAQTFDIDTDSFRSVPLAGILTERFKQRPDAAIVASVVRGAAEVLRDAVNEAYGIELVVARPDMPIGVRVGVPSPDGVGIDRLLTAGETFSSYKSALVVISCGTAITLDVVSTDGVYLGGTISPGLRTAAWALSARTSLLPEVELHGVGVSNVPDSTIPAIQVGVTVGAAGAIDRLVRELARMAGIESYRVILTGGDSRRIGPFLECDHRIEDDLVLKGLARTFSRLKGPPGG